jgi:TonB-dependent SusC/RagA subfamily outer membrane receptor
MRGFLPLVLGALAAACMPAKPKATAPSPSPMPPPVTTAVCDKGDSGPTIYLIDGKPVTCTAAMSLPSYQIESVAVVKGAAAVSLYGPLAASGVVLIETKRER